MRRSLASWLLAALTLACGGCRAARHVFADRLEDFYVQESQRAVRFEVPPVGAPAFDIILIHVCSLGWDDLDRAGLRDHPFWKSFDYLFTNFNSVTSYTNPSAHRLLHAPCGQMPHAALYRPIPPECGLLDELRRVGFRTYAAYDHDGRYGDFAEDLEKKDHTEPAIPLDGLSVVEHNFDGSDIIDPSALLERWWRQRQDDAAPRAALYFDTTLLHDGAHFVKDKEWWKRDRVDRYREAVLLLFADVQRFMELVAASGRPAVVVFVPEHGMGLRGSRFQPTGKRDIPLPRLTLVPVAVKVINGGPGAAGEFPRVSDAPVSHLALAEMLAAFLRRPSLAAGDSGALLESLPRTPFVSENSGVRIAEKDGQLYLYPDYWRRTLLEPEDAEVPRPRWRPK